MPTSPTAQSTVLVAACGLVTTTNFCIPSTLLGAWWRWRGAPEATT